MRHVAAPVLCFRKADEGPTVVEDTVMLALIVVVCLLAITALRGNANVPFGAVCGWVASTTGS